MKLFVKKHMGICESRCKGMSLWTRTRMKINTSSPRACDHDTSPRSQGTSLCIYQKASYTIEAVVVLPCMAAFFASVLFFFPLLQVQVAVEEAVFYAGSKTAVESCLVESEEVLLATAKGYFLYALKDNKAIEQYVKGGSLGITLLGSYCDEEEVVLRAGFRVTIPIVFWELDELSFCVENTFQKWNGDQVHEGSGDEVYITDTGNVYHSSVHCRALDLSLREVSFENIENERGKNGQKYYPCSRCCDREGMVSFVFCTDYGTLYHADLSCSALKRSIRKISKDEIGERLMCRFCENKE